MHGQDSRCSVFGTKTLPRDMWSGRRLTEIQGTSRSDYLWPEILSGMSNADHRAIEKPKLDDARKLRGNYFSDPEDGGFQETIQNAMKK